MAKPIKLDTETIDYFADHVQVLKASEVDGTIVCQTSATSMSYFSPSGKARLATKRSYGVYAFRKDDREQIAYMGASTKTDANREFSRMCKDIAG